MVDTLKHCAHLKAIFRRQAGAWLDIDTLLHARMLCVRAAAATDDPQVRIELARIETYAERLHSHRDSATDLLRERILLTLDAVEDRLHAHFAAPERGDARISALA